MASRNDGILSSANGTRFKPPEELEKHDSNAEKHRDYTSKQNSVMLEESNTLLELYSLEQLGETFLFEEMNGPSSLQQNLGEGRNELWPQIEQQQESQNVSAQHWEGCFFQQDNEPCWPQQEPQREEHSRTFKDLRPSLLVGENQIFPPKECFNKNANDDSSFLKRTTEKQAKQEEGKQWSQCLYEQSNELSASLPARIGVEWPQVGEGRQYLNQQSRCEVNRKRKQCLFEQEQGVAQGKSIKQEQAGTFLQNAQGLQRPQDQERFSKQWKQCLFQQEEDNIASSQGCFQQEHENGCFQMEQEIYSSQKQEGRAKPGWRQALLKQHNAVPDADVSRQQNQAGSANGCPQEEQATECYQSEGSLTQQWQEYLFQSLDEVLNGQLRQFQENNISTYKEAQSVIKQQSGCEAEQNLHQSLSSYDRTGYIKRKLNQKVKYNLDQRY
eukprot:Seg2268.3 transcript_id=Seg2268.3/GoldUCD/mRNA.D3Y31 product="hypothetical protein" protein_id=Seg2268.3/GoldUCD/D3Y31